MLTEVLRWTGVLIALAGSVFAAPEADLRAWRRSQNGVRELEARVATVWRRLTHRPHPTAEIPLAPALLNLTATGAAGSGGSGWISGSSFGARVRVLEEQLASVQADLEALRQTQVAEIAERERALTDLERRLTGAVAQLRDTVTSMERDATEVDLTSLPLVGLGVLVSGVPDHLAVLWPVGVGFLVVSVVAFVWGLRRFVRHLRRLVGRHATL